MTKALIAHWLNPFSGWWNDRQADWIQEALSLCNWSWWVEETSPVVFPYPLSFSPDQPDSLISLAWEFKPWGILNSGRWQMEGHLRWSPHRWGIISHFTHQMWSSVWWMRGGRSRMCIFFSNQQQIWLPVQKLTYLHLCVSLRWRRHGRPLSQCPLLTPGGYPLPEPLNVAPSLSSLPVKETL